jgi:hypothetical protein
MQIREYNFVTSIETGTQPDAGTPTVSADLITLGYVQSNLTFAPSVTGSIASPYAVVAGTGVPFSVTSGVYNYIRLVQGSGGAVDISANPQIAAGTIAGQRLLLRGCSDTNTVKLEDGTGIKINGDCILSSGTTIEMFWDGTFWCEISRNML